MRWWLKGVIAILLVGAAGLTVGAIAPITLGDQEQTMPSPYREAVLLVAMLAGMMARMLSLAIEKRRTVAGQGAIAAAPLQLDKWEFVYPTLFAVPTFSALLSQVPSGGVTPAVLALAFQNGFFWQTLLKRQQSEP